MSCLDSQASRHFPTLVECKKHPASHPGVHLEKSRRFHLFNVDGFALIQDREVHGHSNFLAEYPHKWKGATSAMSRLACASPPRLRIFKPRRYRPVFRFASKIAAFFRGFEGCSSRSFWVFRVLRLIFRVGESIAALRGGFQNIQGRARPRRRELASETGMGGFSYKFPLCPQYRIHVQDIEQTLATIPGIQVSMDRES